MHRLATALKEVDEESGEINVEGERVMWCSVQCDDALTDTGLCTHVIVFDVLCVEVGFGCPVVVGVGRVIVQRHHAHITND